MTRTSCYDWLGRIGYVLTVSIEMRAHFWNGVGLEDYVRTKTQIGSVRKHLADKTDRFVLSQNVDVEV